MAKVTDEEIKKALYYIPLYMGSYQLRFNFAFESEDQWTHFFIEILCNLPHVPMFYIFAIQLFKVHFSISVLKANVYRKGN